MCCGVLRDVDHNLNRQSDRLDLEKVDYIPEACILCQYESNALVHYPHQENYTTSSYMSFSPPLHGLCREREGD